MIAVIIFAVSFLLLSILFLSKHREAITGEKNSLGKALTPLDNKASKVLYAIHYRFYQLVQTIKFVFLVKIPEKGRVKIHKTKDSVVKEYKKQKDVIMGKKELNQNGSASFFLRKIDETKNKKENDSERGRIEDDSIDSLKN